MGVTAIATILRIKVGNESPQPDHAIGDFDAAAAVRRRKFQALPMSERLARMHALNKQLSAIKGVARDVRGRTQNRADLKILPKE